MTISMNAQRVTRIYRGTTKVYEDDNFEAIPINFDSNSSGTVFIIYNEKTAYIIGTFTFGGAWGKPFGTYKSSKKISGEVNAVASTDGACSFTLSDGIVSGLKISNTPAGISINSNQQLTIS